MSPENAAPAPLDLSLRQDQISLIDLGLILLQRLKLLVILPLTAGAMALGVSFLMTPIYSASAQILIPQQQSAASAVLGSLGGLAGAVAGGALAGLKNPADQWVGLLKSRTVADALIAKFNLKNIYESQFIFQAREALAARTAINAGKDGLIDIEVDDTDPKRATALVQAYIDELQKLSNSMALTEAAQRRVFFERQLSVAKDNLIKAEVVLKASGINASVLKTSPDAAVGALAQLQAQVAAQEVAVSVMRQSQTENSSDLQRAMVELSSLRAQLHRAEKADPAAATSNGAEYVAKYREFKYFETLFELMARQYELARLDEARNGALIQVVDAPVEPEYKSKPKRGLIAVMAAATTLLLTLFYVLIQHGIAAYARRPEGAQKLASLKRAVTFRQRT